MTSIIEYQDGEESRRDLGFVLGGACCFVIQNKNRIQKKKKKKKNEECYRVRCYCCRFPSGFRYCWLSERLPNGCLASGGKPMQSLERWSSSPSCVHGMQGWFLHLWVFFFFFPFHDVGIMVFIKRNNPPHSFHFSFLILFSCWPRLQGILLGYPRRPQIWCWPLREVL